jgi:pimeloyl-ACP methyl ester carboxylesterase
MKKYATFYDLYLNGRQTPRQIIAVHPELGEIWYDEPEHQYERPSVFYHQLQELNLAEAWSKVDAPVLAVHGEYDWVMSADDYQLLVADLNSRHPLSAQFVIWPKADHGLYSHATLQKAFGRDPAHKYDSELTLYVVNWLAKH